MPVQLDTICGPGSCRRPGWTARVHVPPPIRTPPVPPAPAWFLAIVTPVRGQRCSARCRSCSEPPASGAVLNAIVESLIVIDAAPRPSPTLTTPPPSAPIPVGLVAVDQGLLIVMVPWRFAIPPPLSAEPAVTRTRVSVTVLPCASRAPPRPAGAEPPCSVEVVDRGGRVGDLQHARALSVTGDRGRVGAGARDRHGVGDLQGPARELVVWPTGIDDRVAHPPRRWWP